MCAPDTSSGRNKSGDVHQLRGRRDGPDLTKKKSDLASRFLFRVLAFFTLERVALFSEKTAGLGIYEKVFLLVEWLQSDCKLGAWFLRSSRSRGFIRNFANYANTRQVWSISKARFTSCIIYCSRFPFSSLEKEKNSRKIEYEKRKVARDAIFFNAVKEKKKRVEMTYFALPFCELRFFSLAPFIVCFSPLKCGRLSNAAAIFRLKRLSHPEFKYTACKKNGKPCFFWIFSIFSSSCPRKESARFNKLSIPGYRSKWAIYAKEKSSGTKSRGKEKFRAPRY